jgi:hypothetical protein
MQSSPTQNHSSAFKKPPRIAILSLVFRGMQQLTKHAELLSQYPIYQFARQFALKLSKYIAAILAIQLP